MKHFCKVTGVTRQPLWQARVGHHVAHFTHLPQRVNGEVNSRWQSATPEEMSLKLSAAQFFLAWWWVWPLSSCWVWGIPSMLPGDARWTQLENVAASGKSDFLDQRFSIPRHNDTLLDVWGQTDFLFYCFEKFWHTVSARESLPTEWEGATVKWIRLDPVYHKATKTT